MASTSSAPHMHGPLDIDGILGTSLSAWPRLMFAFGPIYALQVLPTVLQGQMGQPHGAAVWGALAAPLFGLVIGIVCSGALTIVAEDVLNGGQPRILSSIKCGVRRFLPLLGACSLAGLALVLGLVLLIVPGLIVATWYFVVVPVCVLEGLGPTDSLRRSAALSRGVRWRLFGLAVILAVAGAVGAACTHIAQEEIGGIWAAAINVLVTTGAGIFGVTVPVVTYRVLTASSLVGRLGET